MKSFSLAAVLLLAGCSAASTSTSDTAGSGILPPVQAGALIAIDSLTSLDGQPFPCCQTDSASIHITTVSGTLNFFAATHYDDSVFTPGGIKPKACVQEVPSGSFLAQNQMLTLPDGSKYLLMPCNSGGYQATVKQRLDYPDGSSTTRDVLVSSGAYAWSRDKLSLTDYPSASQPASTISGANISVSVGAHQYRFVAIKSH